jgi:hypothetical protein
MNTHEVELTQEQAKDLKIQGNKIKLINGYGIVKTDEGWKIQRL